MANLNKFPSNRALKLSLWRRNHGYWVFIMQPMVKDWPVRKCYGFALISYTDLVHQFFELIVPGKHPDDCWGWLGSLVHGYAVLKFNGRQVKGSRLSWELHSGLPMRVGTIMFHECNNPACCNPRHVRPETHLENMAHMRRCGRERHPRGDELATKMTALTVAQMRSDYATGKFSYRTLGNKYGISKTHARYIVSGTKWKSVGGPLVPIKPFPKDKFSGLKMSNGLRYYYRRLKKQMPEGKL